MLVRKEILVFLLLAITFSTGIIAQEEVKKEFDRDYYQYDIDFLPASFHKTRRDSLRKYMPDSSALILFASPERNRSNDVYYEYHQDPNFYYLTGFREPNSMLIIYKENQSFEDFESNEILFIPERSASSELWNGRRLGTEHAEEKLLIKKVIRNTDFKGFDAKIQEMSKVYYEKPYALEQQDTSSTANLNGLFVNFQQSINDKSKTSERMAGLLLAKMRAKKTDEEIVLLRKAIDITCLAQNELMKQIKPEMAEYETEALVEYVFKKNGAEYPGFPSIQGSGENSCILHYTSNRRPLKNGGLLVSDIGAEYRAYTADVTRTIPPQGKFSKEEKQIYNLVLKAQTAGIKASVVGSSFWKPGEEATQIIAEGLQKLGIIKERSEVRKYFMHGTSHYLGLDVHDPGLYSPLEEGNVITVEPGIYIAEGSDCDPKWWNIGVRIEDDILITSDGPENLSIKSPRTIKEIEALMRENE